MKKNGFSQLDEHSSKGEPIRELILVSPFVSNFIIRCVFTLLFKQRIPLSLLTLSALTPRDYKIRIFNQKLLWTKKDLPAGALVGITCVTSSANNAYKLASRFRKAGVYVVMGGPHVSALPEEALQYCDSVVIGEAESVWSEVIKDFENKSLKKIYKGEPLEDFFSPVYEYFLKLPPRILRRTEFKVSRGCKYNCDFCARASNWPRYVRTEQVVEVIKRAKEDIRLPFYKFPIGFAEDNIYSNPDYAKELFKALIPLKIKWGSQSSLDIAFDDEALRLAHESGCVEFFIGFETIYPHRYQKTSTGNIVSIRDYFTAVKKIKSYGIKVTGAFIIGFDYYTHLDYLRLLLFMVKSFFKSRFLWISLTILTPFPGTDLFRRLSKEGRIRTLSWGEYSMVFNLVFKPKNMSTFSLMAWFFVIRIVSFVLSTLGIFVLLILYSPEILHYLHIHINSVLYGVPTFK